MAAQNNVTSGFSTSSRAKIGLNVGISIVAVLALAAMINYLATRHYKRWYLGEQALTGLSDATKLVLAAVTNEVHVTVMFDRNNPLYGPVMGLLKEYRNQCANLVVEHVDYKRDLARAQTLMTRHQLAPTETDLVIIEYGGRARLIRDTELSDYDLTGALTPSREIKRIAFKGEALFTTAIGGLLDQRSQKLYYLQGHGEHDLASTETKFGYSRFAQLLAQKNIQALPLWLSGTSDVPEDCQVLMIAGPKGRISQDEVERIGRYLNRGGRLLALLSLIRSGQSDTGLEPLLAAWGVAVGRQFAFDKNNTVVGGGIICTNFSMHPIVKPLRGEAIYVVLARPVDPTTTPGQSADAPRAEPLFATSTEGFTASELSESGVARSNPVRDRHGTIPLAVAVDKGSIRGVGADKSATRIVVAGESIFLANETILKASGNLGFANLAINWLLDRPTQLAGIPPRPLREFSITLPKTALWRLTWMLVLVMPGVPLVIGLVVWFKRRR
ncbi:MAG: Gldg family protein [Verrucomicrobiota bacterium]|nr:Gldg family protein [Verrucomicrobiota bacterium]